ncbi:MAG: hypothetical protein ACLRRT_14010 [Ruthenibacterium lactatiformans]
MYKYLTPAPSVPSNVWRAAELADDTVPRKGRGTALRTHGLSGRRVDYESDTSWHYAMLDAPENWKSWQWMKTTRYSGW